MVARALAALAMVVMGANAAVRGSEEGRDLAILPGTGSNSNKCLADLGGIKATCPTGSGFSIPSYSCCSNFHTFMTDSCGCNPLVRMVMGTDSKGVSQLDNLIGGLNLGCLLYLQLPVIQFCGLAYAPSGISSGGGKSYNGGTCAYNDSMMDALRFSTISKFSTYLLIAGTQTTGCFNFTLYLANLRAAFDPDSANPYILAPYAGGKYIGTSNMAEYGALAIPIINKLVWQDTGSFNPTPDSMLYVGQGGSTIITGSDTTRSMFNYCQVTQGYDEQVFGFVGCSTTMNSFTVDGTSHAPAFPNKPTDIGPIVSDFYKAVTRSDSWGLKDICHYHDQYCTGPLQQYADFNSCMSFMKSLPAISPACGAQGALGGNSTLCRFKHHFMIALQPDVHCYHIGPGNMDTAGHVKCTDTECVGAYGDPSLINLGDVPSADACIANQDAITNSLTSWPFPNVCPGTQLTR